MERNKENKILLLKSDIYTKDMISLFLKHGQLEVDVIDINHLVKGEYEFKNKTLLISDIIYHTVNKLMIKKKDSQTLNSILLCGNDERQCTIEEYKGALNIVGCIHANPDHNIIQSIMKYLNIKTIVK